MTDRILTPWYGTENMETDAPVITSCGKTVEPIRVPGGSAVKEMKPVSAGLVAKYQSWGIRNQRDVAYRKHFGPPGEFKDFGRDI